MNIPGITWQGESIEDVEILRALPADLVRLLSHRNGFIVHDGAVHVRGACLTPDWHSLRVAWRGPKSFSVLYPEVKPSDIPFRRITQCSVSASMALDPARPFGVNAGTSPARVDTACQVQPFAAPALA
jgi:hypothetical protein